MWLFLPEGFVSIVAIPSKPAYLMIRARRRKHLLAIKHTLDAGEIYTTPKSDYRFRMLAPRDAVGDWMRRVVERIDYTNFKDAAHDASPKDQGWHRALGNVWMDMYELQDPRPLPPPISLDEIDAVERRLGLDTRKNPPPPQEG